MTQAIAYMGKVARHMGYINYSLVPTYLDKGRRRLIIHAALVERDSSKEAGQ